MAKDAHTYIYVQYGCGLCAPKSWMNFDASPSLRLQHLPLFGKFFRGWGLPPFPKHVRYGDIVRGLPVAINSCDAIYCSHVLEHLALNDFRTALKNTYSYLKVGGVFRLVVPDIEFLAHRYLASPGPTASIVFIEGTGMGLKDRHRSLTAFLRAWLGHSKHSWMWDFPGMSAELVKVGFRDLRPALQGDSKLECFKVVEDPARWKDCLGMECSK